MQGTLLSTDRRPRLGLESKCDGSGTTDSAAGSLFSRIFRFVRMVVAMGRVEGGNDGVLATRPRRTSAVHHSGLRFAHHIWRVVPGPNWVRLFDAKIQRSPRIKPTYDTRRGGQEYQYEIKDRLIRVSRPWVIDIIDHPLRKVEP